MVEIATDEKVLAPPVRCSVLHDYEEPFAVQVRAYALEEIVAEKLRAILQHLRALEHRGWARSRARDYYDLWRILATYRDRLNVSDFPAFLSAKCALRRVTFSGPESFFPEAMLLTVHKRWEQWLGPLVPTLPTCETVMTELRPQIAALLGFGP